MPLPLARSPTVLLDCASRRFACLSSRPACRWNFRSEDRLLRRKPPDVLRPFLGKPLLRPALLTKVPKNRGNRVAREAISSSGASTQLATVRTRKLFPLPAGGDRTFGHLPHLLSVAGFPMRPGPPSRSHEHHAHRFRVAEAKFSVTSLWITGISGATVGTLPKSRIWPGQRLAGPHADCRSVPLRLPRYLCPNLPSALPSLLIWRT